MTTSLDEERDERENESIRREVAWAASLSDADRIRILRDLLRTVEAIRRTKSAEELHREDSIDRAQREEGLARYRACAERLEGR